MLKKNFQLLKKRKPVVMVVVSLFIISVSGLAAVTNWQEVDFNADGKVNSLDLVEMFRFFGCPGNCPTTPPTGPPNQGLYTDCSVSRLGASIQTEGAFNDSAGPEVVELSQEGYSGLVGSLNCTDVTTYFPQLPEWDKAAICNSHTCLTNRATPGGSACSSVDFEYLSYGPERLGGVPPAEKYNLPWATEVARQIADGAGKKLIISYSTQQLHEEADERGFGWDNPGEVVKLLAQYGDVWMIQAADEFNNPNVTGHDGPILSQMHYEPGPEWRAAVEQWVNWIKAANPNIKIWIQLALHRLGPPEDPPSAETVLAYREWLVNPKYGPPLVDGVYISSIYSYPTTAGPAESDYQLQRAFRLSCGQQGTPPPTGGTPPPTGLTPPPTGGTPPPSVPPGSISLVEEGWTDNISIGCNNKGICLTVVPGFYYRIFENSRYPCGTEGNHQFIVFDRGESQMTAKNLFAKFPGGGVGFWYYNSSGQKTYYNNPNALGILTANYGWNTFFRTAVTNEYGQGITKKFRENSDFRIMVASYCSHDLYHGTGQCSSVDGFCRYGNLAANEALTFVEQNYNVNKIITFGGSAGASGSFKIGKNRSKVAGIIMDSFSDDLSAISDGCKAGKNVFGGSYPCFCPTNTCMEELAPRIGYNLGVDEPYLQVNQDKITTPIYLVWNERDASVNAPLLYNNLHQAIESYNSRHPGADWVANKVCITNPASPPGPICNLHVPSGQEYDYKVTTSDTTTAKDLVQNIYDWALRQVNR